jgi:ribosome-binding factor A
MEKTRQEKIERLVQKELSEMFLLQTKAMHGVMVSVSHCKVSPDLSYCNAYVSVFPSERAKEMIDNLTANVKTVRYDLGQRLRHQLRIIPELRFFVDDTLDYMEHIDELLKK